MPKVRISMDYYMKFLHEWADGLDDINCRCLTAQAEYFISRGDLHQAIMDLIDAISSSNRPDATVHLLDAIKFLEECERSQAEPAIASEYEASARQAIRRFKMPDALAVKMGRVALPVFAKPVERQIFRLFKTFGSMTYADLAEHLKISKSSVKRALDPMIERGVIIRSETKPGETAVFYIAK